MGHPYRSPSSPTPARPTRSTRRAPRPFGSRPKKPIPLWERILLGVFGSAVFSLFIGLGTLAYRDFFPTKEKPGIRFVEPAPLTTTISPLSSWQTVSPATGIYSQSNDFYFRHADGTTTKLGGGPSVTTIDLGASSRWPTYVSKTPVAPYRAVRNKLAPK